MPRQRNPDRATAPLGEEEERELFERIRAGIGLHRAGRLDEARDAYKSVLAVQPCNASALNMLGVLAHDQRKFAEAERLIATAVAFYQLVQNRLPGFAGQRWVDTHMLQVIAQSFQVFVNSEQVTIVCRDYFINAIAENEAAIQRRDTWLIFRQILAIVVDGGHLFDYSKISMNLSDIR